MNAAERDLRDYLEDTLDNARKLTPRVLYTTATREIDVVIKHLPAIIAELG